VKETIILIGCLLLLGIVLIVVAYIGEWIWALYIKRKFPDYDRALSESEREFVNTSKTKLHEFAEEGSYNSGFNWILYLVSIAAVVLSWVLFYYGSKWLGDFYEGHNLNSDSLGANLWTERLAISASHIIGMFVGVFVIASLFQILTRNLSNFNAWAMLMPDKHIDQEAILQKRYSHIEHNVRIRKLNPLDKFDPLTFLNSITQLHGRRWRALTYPLLGFLGVFVVLDLFDYDFFYERGLRYSHYFDLSYSELLYEDLDKIEVSCVGNNEDGRDNYLKFTDTDGHKLAQIEVKYSNLKVLSVLDDKLRQRNVRFKIAEDSFSFGCANKSLIRMRSYQDLFTKVMHLKELRDSKQ